MFGGRWERNRRVTIRERAACGVDRGCRGGGQAAWALDWTVRFAGARCLAVRACTVRGSDSLTPANGMLLRGVFFSNDFLF